MGLLHRVNWKPSGLSISDAPSDPCGEVVSVAFKTILKDKCEDQQRKGGESEDAKIWDFRNMI
jgi:hypothetical protein